MIDIKIQLENMRSEIEKEWSQFMNSYIMMCNDPKYTQEDQLEVLTRVNELQVFLKALNAQINDINKKIEGQKENTLDSSPSR